MDENDSRVQNPEDARRLETDAAPAALPAALPAAPPAAPPPAALPNRTRRHRLGALVATVAASVALAVGLFAGGAAWSVWSGLGTASTVVNEDSAASRTPDLPRTYADGWQQLPEADPGQETVPDSTTSGSTDPASGTSAATTDQQVGLVTIVTTLGYQQARAAGTGIVLTADGEILTNNHVIAGATSIEVTVESTGDTYAATVLGTGTTTDVALLQLTDARGLDVAAVDRDGAAVGQAVTAVGNAEGGGELLAAPGLVTALDESISTRSVGVSAGQNLTGLIEINADVVSGDSGGAVLDAEGEVVGMTTAASSGLVDIRGYAIPIDEALAVVAQIEAGSTAGDVTIGYPAFLGVGLAGDDVGSGGGATISGAYDDTPAADAGLAAGDTITGLDGAAVDSGDTLSSLMQRHAPGDEVTLTWTTAAGEIRSATATLIAGPAD